MKIEGEDGGSRLKMKFRMKIQDKDWEKRLRMKTEDKDYRWRL